MEKSNTIESYRDLEVWQRGIALTERVYAITESFPESEKFGLTSQLRRAVVSVPSNIAEGWTRNSKRDYVRFLRIARGSLSEIETQVIIAQKLGYISESEDDLLQSIRVESKMLLSLIRSLTRK